MSSSSLREKISLSLSRATGPVKSKKAFTLVELMIAIAIIGVLAASLFPMMSGYMSRARDTATQANIRKVMGVLQSNMMDSTINMPLNASGNSSWRCVPLLDTTLPCSSYAGTTYLPIDPIPLRVKDFNINVNTDYGNIPLFGRMQDAGVYDRDLTENGTKGVHILTWGMVGASGYTGTVSIISPVHIEKANARCRPGVVRWISPSIQQTMCGVVVDS